MMTAGQPRTEWKWTSTYLVHSYEVDPRGKVALPAICKLMQETAYHNADHLGFGYHQLMEKQLFWVLSRLLIRMWRYPAWGETIRVQTWPSGVERLFAFRDFRMVDEAGNVLGAASSAWLILDAVKHRPQRPEELRDRIKSLPPERALPERPGKIPPPDQGTPGQFFPVRYSDLALYNHVNNAQYIQWILDSFPGDLHREAEVILFEINFLYETQLGDQVAIHTETLETSPPSFRHAIKRKADSRDICLARSEWTGPNVTKISV
jgi:medium-chain acyl-[acyl-carrier-protein] hydrolase